MNSAILSGPFKVLSKQSRAFESRLVISHEDLLYVNDTWKTQPYSLELPLENVEGSFCTFLCGGQLKNGLE